MAGNAENLAVGQGVRSTLIYRHFVVCLPTTGSIIHAAGVPVKYLAASPGPMSTVTSSAFALSARALPGCEDSSIRKSHIRLSFPQRKLTKRHCNGIITLCSNAPSKPLVLLTPSSVPADGGFCLYVHIIPRQVSCRNKFIRRLFRFISTRYIYVVLISLFTAVQLLSFLL